MTLTFTAAQEKAIAALACRRQMDPEHFAKALILEAISPPTITIKQVAEVARVSPMTVSLALNNVIGANGVSEKTQKRILTLAKKMGWRPSVTAQSLRRKRI